MSIQTFGVLAFIALATALATHDWRLKFVAISCSAVWLTTVGLTMFGLTSLLWMNPVYTAFIFGVAFCIQARGEIERERGEPLAMWLLVPMGVEAVIGVSYVIKPILPAWGQWRLMQVGFAIELICLIVVGGKRLNLVGRIRRSADLVLSLIGKTLRPA